MKARIIIIYLCVAFLPSTIRGYDDFDEIKEKLNKMAEKNEIINYIFQPSINGSLGEGSCGVLFKGTLLRPIRREVAMKFTPSRIQIFASEEYKIYSYLNAINSTDVERYGIPSVFYYGEWNDYILMGLTLLDGEFNKRLENKQFDGADALIVMQQFLKTLKYIHSRGIYHNDIKPYNIMFRRNEAFIIDYNLATKMYGTDKIGTFNILLTRDHENKKRTAKSDWQSFFYTMCHFYGVRLNWLGFGSNPKEDLRRIVQQIEEIESDGIKRVINAYVNYAFEDQINEHLSDDKSKHKLCQCHDAPHFPIYDHLYQIISETIEKFDLPKPILVSWLKDEDVEKAKEELAATPNISFIRNQFEKVDANYPEVHFDYFHSKQKNLSGNNNRKGTETAEHSNTTHKEK